MNGEPHLRRYRLTARVRGEILVCQQIVTTTQLRYGIHFTRHVRDYVRERLQRAVEESLAR